MPDDEGIALHLAARRAVALGRGPLVEIGAYRGRSTLYLAAGIAAATGVPSAADRRHRSALLYSVDHHRGSEEMQAGWAHHDPSLVDPETGRMDSLQAWRSSVVRAEADDLVVGVVGDSARVAENWATELSLVFVDGGHGRDVAWADYRGWSRHLAPGGLLVFHDVFPDPRDGGRPPYECFLDAIASGSFAEEQPASRHSLRVLRRIA
ncbi:MAG: class I SAM-dependent methyltransferase [Acidimicrobiales bacterium]